MKAQVKAGSYGRCKGIAAGARQARKAPLARSRTSPGHRRPYPVRSHRLGAGTAVRDDERCRAARHGHLRLRPVL